MRGRCPHVQYACSTQPKRAPHPRARPSRRVPDARASCPAAPPQMAGLTLDGVNAVNGTLREFVRRLTGGVSPPIMPIQSIS